MLQGSYMCYFNCPQPNYRVVTAGVCQDTDECALNRDICGNKHYKCVNTFGGFDCKRISCSKGYDFRNGVCWDNDECKEANKCGSKGFCINTRGSYYCRCQSGYDVDQDTGKCTDVDECTRPYAYCAYNCTNTPGSYKCSCPSGYQMSVNSGCMDINECATSNPCNGSETCVNTLGGAECVDGSCPNDYYVRVNSRTCRKKWCQHNDEKCKGIMVSSIKWVSYALTKYHSFSFVYRMSGFRADLQIHFALVAGNEENIFDTRTTGYRGVTVFNAKSLPAGRKFHITMNADIMRGRKLVDRYVYKFHIFVSPYGF